MTLDEYRMPETKKEFRDYLKGLPEQMLVNPGDVFGCFFCGFVKSQLGMPPAKHWSVQFLWDTYLVGDSPKERPLPEWAKQFTSLATEAAVSNAMSTQHIIGRLTAKEALEVLRKC